MSETKHTPGPWEAEPPTPDPEYGESPKYHWTVRAPGRSGGCISFQLAEISSLNCPEDEADARLIAAAPELLEALKDLLADIESLMGESYGVVGLHLNGDVAPWSDLDEGGQFERLSSLSAARAAIAKATGAADG